MRRHLIGLVLAMSAVAAFPARAALVISEVVFNEVSGDVTGEWIEIFNTGPAAIDLSNYKIGDEEASGSSSATEALFQFPAGATINPGQVQIVAVSATRFNDVYGFLPTYETAGTEGTVPDLSIYSSWDLDGGQIAMSNTNDQAVIVDPMDAVIDAASWGNNFAFNPSLGTAADGQSWERRNVYIDTDTAGDWQLGPNPSGSVAADRSTPGVANVPEPASVGIAVLALAALAPALRRK
jgi:Lamin Tail Domain